MGIDVLLLHGAWCGPWSWAPLIDALRAHGLTAAAPALPIEDPDATREDYLAAAAAELDDADRPVVVGHSLAGMLLEPLARMRPVRHLVYVTAFVPAPGMSLREQWRADPSLLVSGWNRGVRRVGADGSRWTDLDAARHTLFGGCRPDVGRDAARRLRVQEWGVADARFEGAHETPRTYVAALEDGLVDSAGQQRAARRLLGVDAVRLPGGHSPMLAHPGRLAGIVAPLCAGAPSESIDTRRVS